MGRFRSAEQLKQERADFCEKVVTRLKKEMRSRRISFEECEYYSPSYLNDIYGIWAQSSDSMLPMEITAIMESLKKDHDIEYIEEESRNGIYEWDTKLYILPMQSVTFRFK